jgi:hypothetical protein
VLQIGFGQAVKAVHPRALRLAFTLTPHLQPINYRVRFRPFIGI